jgi:predicted DNA-binding ribbon-helix-helix protein
MSQAQYGIDTICSNGGRTGNLASSVRTIVRKYRMLILEKSNFSYGQFQVRTYAVCSTEKLSQNMKGLEILELCHALCALKS